VKIDTGQNMAEKGLNCIHNCQFKKISVNGCKKSFKDGIKIDIPAFTNQKVLFAIFLNLEEDRFE